MRISCPTSVTTTLSGISVKVDEYSVRVGDKKFNFKEKFEEKINSLSASISGHFISIITDENQLFLITTTTNSLYVDLLQSSEKFVCRGGRIPAPIHSLNN